MILDRFESDWAVIEYNGTTFNLPRSLLPGDAREGDVLEFVVKVDRTATKQRRIRIRSLEDDLFR